MKLYLRTYLSIALALMLALTGQSMALARGATDPVGQMVLCTGTGLITILVDENGEPTGAPYICPDCALNLLSAATLPDMVALTANARTCGPAGPLRPCAWGKDAHEGQRPRPSSFDLIPVLPTYFRLIRKQERPMSFKSTLLAAAVALSFATVANAGDTITIHDAYARSSTAQSTTGAVFLIVMNSGQQSDRLIGVHSDIAKRVELHSNIEDANGVMKMMHLEDGIIIPAGGSHALKRGGDHVMMMGLTQGLVQGDVISVTLTFENAGDVTVEVPVDLTRKPGAKAHSMKHNTDG